MKCQMCGEINKLDVRYCESCGARLDAPISVTASTDAQGLSALTCRQCSAVILPGERSCEQCGAPVSSGSMESTGLSGELRVSDLPAGGFADTAHDMNAFHAPIPSSMSGPLQYTIEQDTQDETVRPSDEQTQEAVIVADNNGENLFDGFVPVPVDAPAIATPVMEPVAAKQYTRLSKPALLQPRVPQKSRRSNSNARSSNKRYSVSKISSTSSMRCAIRSAKSRHKQC